LWKSKDEAANPGYDVLAERPESVATGRAWTRGPERAKVLRAVHPPPEELLDRVFPPMLATLVDAPPPDEANWVCEVKYDGFRALCALSGGRVAMWSRNRLDLAGRFPAIADALGKLVVGEAVIDGEAVSLDESGISRFQRLQQSGQSVLFAFDLLWLDGEDLRARPLEQRRDLLESLFANPPAGVRLAERVPGGPAAALRWAAQHGEEGVVCKARRSVYEPRRSKCWLKLKASNTQELAIVGFTLSKGPANQLGALLLGVMERGALRFAGKVGTGFTAKQRTQLLGELKKDAIDAPAVEGAPRMRAATWVRPRLVAQVQFTEWTGDGKLRHPSFQGLRADKSPGEAVRERAVASPAPAIAVALSHADKVLYPDLGLTKQDVADYYQALSEPLIQALRDRPLALEHWPKGITHPSWFHQNIGREGEDWMSYADTPTSASGGKTVRHLVVDRPETLRWLAQHNALTLHMWSSRVPRLTMPDWVVFDLDPADGHGIEQTIEVAHTVRKLLDELALPSLPKTSGKRGLHVLVPIAAGHSYDDVLEFALRIGGAVTSVLKQTTLERRKRDRKGRLYFDCYQNGYGKTVVAPYSPRALPGAPVSTPLRWSEVGPALDPARFNLRTLPARVAEVGDLWAETMARGVRLPRFE
jgi:bifunctional non-homologous end joining protein LigD